MDKFELNAITKFVGLVVIVGVMALSCVKLIPAGHVGVKDFFGKVSDQVLYPGIHFVLPMTKVVKFSTRTQSMKEAASVPTSEGLVVSLDVSLLYHVKPSEAVTIYKTIGEGYEYIVIDPQLRSVIRDVTAGYEAKFLYSTSRELVAQNMFEHLKKLLDSRGIEAEQVLLRAIQLPELLTTAIQEKLQAEQQSQRMKFVLEKEKQEAERKRVEAQGVSDFQNIVSKGLSSQLLKWKAIEVAGDLSKSQNAKIIVLGDKTGLPIILSDK
ncbi:MAG: prohibitin family protein [Deltaproteobacteria bacterium]|nr:prohibitin family protein [Deltaproteobacteria bacterium]